MSTGQITAWAVGAVLVFWGVGAYNRLVSLRNDISRAFVPVDAQIRQRHQLLEQWVDALRPARPGDAVAFDAVIAACGQLQAACDVVRSRPSAARPMASLRLAEDTLAEARLRLKGVLPAGADELAALGVASLTEELATADNTLVFARRQFNQDDFERFWPTSVAFWLIAGLFGFRGAGIL